MMALRNNPGRGGHHGRCDLAVILARGKSTRMGQPKGLMRLNPGGPVFVKVITELYLPWAKVVVVARHTDHDAYARAVSGLSGVDVLGCEEGGETALSVWLGWRKSAAVKEVTHIWSHPVDLPLVKPETLGCLADCSRENPRALVRPVFESRPGHPVIIPADLLREIGSGSEVLAAPFRDFIAWRSTMNPPLDRVDLPSGDSGTISDFDSPDDLARRGEGSSHV